MRFADPDRFDPFTLFGSVGRHGKNDRADVIKAQLLLAGSGYLDLPTPGVPTGWPGEGLNRAIARLQKDSGLEPDGVLLPLPSGGVSETGEGETMQAMKDSLFDRFQDAAAPTPEDVDRFWDDRARRDPETDGEPQTAMRLQAMDVDGDAPVGSILRPGRVLSDEVPAPPARFTPGAQDAKGPGVRTLLQQTRPSPRGPVPPAQSPTGPHLPQAPRPLMAQPELHQGPLPASESAGRPVVPPTPEQQDAIRQWKAQREQDWRKSHFERQEPAREESPAEQSPQRGRVVIAEDGEPVQVPPLEAWADELDPDDRKFAEALNDAVTLELAKTGADDKRGHPQTRREINIYIASCLEALKKELPDFSVKHFAGGTLDGRGEDYKEEEHIWNHNEDGNQEQAGSRRPDMTFEIARNIVLRVRANTADVYANGRFKPREVRAADGIGALAEDDVFGMAGKAKRGTSDEDIKTEADKFCRDLALETRKKFEKAGEFNKPAPAAPAQYPGTSSARKANEKQKGKR